LRLAATALGPGGRLELEEAEGVQVREGERERGRRRGTANGGDARPPPLDPAALTPFFLHPQPAPALAKALLLAGFVDVARAGPVLTASKPAWAAGAAAPLVKKAVSAAAAVTATGAAAWKLAADDDDEEGGAALIDDDALLTDADRTKPAAAGERERCLMCWGGTAGRVFVS
jgi:hypothetical protein